ncbi:amino acid ABC transporter substrate-binding protein [uncultured Thiodictyon sp.]|uniref:amino acid ABC transporter substrate-binding protein n=1 Tax=uncultured Thiodictyon sp. TaxID=1846217 RepID=UPI0025CCC016|nr:amino acid ABC transporter substrate-binding protein [uncultured Thiodictyon sp.]
MKQHSRWLAALIFLAVLPLTPAPASADTLQDVKARGVLRCGVNGAVPGLSFKDAQGNWSGLDVDFCRAVAAAVLGHKDKLDLVPIPNSERFDALGEGRVDLMSENATWNLSRDLAKGIIFVATLYYDGQGFMVQRSTSTMSARELSGKPICTSAESTSPGDARTYFARNRMEFDLREFADIKAATKAYLSGTCYALTSDLSELYAMRAGLAGENAHRILPEIISKEPLAPAVRRGDDRWFDIVRWTLFTLINAEEAGVDSTNVDAVRGRARADDVQMLLDVDGRTGKLLGLDPGWSYRVISQVGNYAEVFERNLGTGSPLKIARGFNALWRDGGILYAPPAR